MSKIILYHGSYTVVSNPELRKCESGKDFGKGFYLTTSQKQAEKFCKTAVGKAVKNGKLKDKSNVGFVNVFEFEETKDINIHNFFEANAEWLKCVAGHRKGDLFADETQKWLKYDIIIGKIANDNTNRVITAYINGTYGNPSSDSAIQMAISLLETNKLSDQECFKSEKSLKCLKFLESYEVRI